MINRILFLALAIPLSIIGCGGSNNAIEEFDLSLYFYHANLQVAGGQISYVENYYEKPSGTVPVQSPTTSYINTGTRIEDEFTGYTITEDSIEEEGITFTSARSLDRFASLGDVYADGGFESIRFNETCTLQNHIETFDLSTATGPVTIATGIYEDVIQVFCDSTFDTENGGTQPNYNFEQYYAKGIGLIFAEGAWPNIGLGDVYVVPEY